MAAARALDRCTRNPEKQFPHAVLPGRVNYICLNCEVIVQKFTRRCCISQNPPDFCRTEEDEFGPRVGEKLPNCSLVAQIKLGPGTHYQVPTTEVSLAYEQLRTQPCQRGPRQKSGSIPSIDMGQTWAYLCRRYSMPGANQSLFLPRQLHIVFHH